MYQVTVCNISNNKIDRMALLCSSAIPHAYHLTYNCSGAQRLTIYCGDRQQHLLLVHPLSCLSRLQAKPIHYGLGVEVIGGALVNER